jgi:hypothetical protein
MNTRIVVPILALILLSVFATAFALINYANMVKVWPLMSYQPLTLVIGVSFVLGASAGALLVSLLQHKQKPTSTLNTPDAIPTVSVQEHEQAVRL